MKKTSEKRVRDWYDNNPRWEWERLDQDVYHRLEFEVTMKYLERYIKPEFKVVDIGGGPGRYSLEFMKRGHPTTLVDLSESLLSIAQSKVKESGLDSFFQGAFQRSDEELDGFENESFDFTLLLGPMYHLVEQEQRDRALSEALRVTRTGGIIAVAIISRLCPLKDVMFRFADEFAETLVTEPDYYSQLIDSGIYRNLTESPGAFTDAYFATVEEIPGMFEKLNVQLLESFSCESIAAFLNEKTAAFAKDERVWTRFVEILVKTANDPSILGAGEHAVFIGKKTGTSKLMNYDGRAK